jgi:hypothetical protein
VVTCVRRRGVVGAKANWTASGTVSYQDREYDQTGFTGAQPLLAARFVDVEVVDCRQRVGDRLRCHGRVGGVAVHRHRFEHAQRLLRALTRSTKTTTLFIKVTNLANTTYAIATSTINGHTVDDQRQFRDARSPRSAPAEKRSTSTTRSSTPPTTSPSCRAPDPPRSTPWR